jgi:hypothetical protein
MKTTHVAGLILMTVSLASPALAQTVVSGTVIDARTEEPIKGVLVYVEGQSILAESGGDGRFMLLVPPGQYTIAASIIGYALLQTSLEVAAAPIDLTIRLSEGAGAYTERLTVSGSLQAESDAVPGSTSLHGRELENLRGAVLDDPLRALQSLPAATATDDFYSQFAVRGNPFHYVGMVVDGVPTQYLLHSVNGITDGGSIAMINSDTLGSVSLLPGSYPQRTGRRMGAQIDLTTREGDRDQFRGRAGLSGTSAGFLVEGPLAGRKGTWLASVRRSYLDYLIKRIDPEAGFAFGFVDAQAKVVYDLTPKHQVSITGLGGRAVFDEGDPNLGPNEIRKGISRAWLTSLTWRYLPSPRVAITQRVFSTGLRFNNDNDAEATIDAARFSEFGWRLDGSFAVSPRTVVEFGGDAQRLTGNNLLVRQTSPTSGLVTLNSFEQQTSAASVYGQVRFGIGSRVTLTPGARVDRWNLTRSTTTSPWVNGEVRLSERMRLRAGSGIYRQFPELDQVYGVHGGGRDLEPERAVHVDAGIEYTLPHETRLLLNAYSRNERDVLWTTGGETRRLPGGGIAAGAFDAPWVNTLRGQAHGIEVVARREAADGFSGWAGYAYGSLRYTNTQTGERFWADADQRHTVTLYGNYRLSSRTSVSSRFRYGSNYPIAGYIGPPQPSLGTAPLIDGRPAFEGLVSERNTLRLPAYSRLDVRADRAFNWSGRRLVLFVDVANVLNHTNLRNSSYSIDRAGRVFETTESLMPIVPSGGFVFEF